MTHYRQLPQQAAWGVVAAVAFLATACDFNATNPGPILDANLDSVTARRAEVTGARRALADILGEQGGVVYWGAAETFELNPAGSTGSFGIPTELQVGRLRPEENVWSDAARARWVAERAIRRFLDGAKREDSLLALGAIPRRGFVEDSLFTVLYLWAGYSNRMLGENFCDAVIDGGPKLDFKVFFARADSQFTEALRMASALTISAANKANLVNAALAGRASVRMLLAYYNVAGFTWASAIADAAPVPNTYSWRIPFYANDQAQYNAIWHARANAPYRAHTQWGTYYENYYRTTRDARVPWDSVPGGQTLGDAAVNKFAGYPGVSSSNRVPFWPEGKYRARDIPINMSSGWEMRLLEAEYELAVNNSAANAVAKMNLRRAALAPVQPNLTVKGGSPVDSAWTDLKRERMMELWLEGRRLGDVRRWSTSGTAGFGRGFGYGPATTLDGVWITGEATPREHMGTPNGVSTTRDLCFPIGRSEVETNPNLLP